MPIWKPFCNCSKNKVDEDTAITINVAPSRSETDTAETELQKTMMLITGFCTAYQLKVYKKKKKNNNIF